MTSAKCGENPSPYKNPPIDFNLNNYVTRENSEFTAVEGEGGIWVG